MYLYLCMKDFLLLQGCVSTALLIDISSHTIINNSTLKNLDMQKI